MKIDTFSAVRHETMFTDFQTLRTSILLAVDTHGNVF